MTQSSLRVRKGGSSNVRRKLDSEDEIIRIPDCDLDAVAESFRLTLIGRVLNLQGRSTDALIHLLPRNRIWNVEGRVCGTNLGNGRFQFDFDNETDLLSVLKSFPNTIPFWINVTGVPVHFWNDQTFIAISKPLGTWTSLDSKRARIQVSVNIDMPLQFERRIEFPNGDIGRIFFAYEGLYRYCFTCHMILHDENACPQLTPEERELKRQQRAEINAQGDLPSIMAGHEARVGGGDIGFPPPTNSRMTIEGRISAKSIHHPVRTEPTTPTIEITQKTGGTLIGITHVKSKGKAHVIDTPTSREREPCLRPSSIIIREPADRHQDHQSTNSLRHVATSPGDLINAPKHPETDLDIYLGQDLEIALTEDDLALMDAEMLDNDDLLDETPDDNAEKIDAISQLSPAKAATKTVMQEDLLVVPRLTAPPQAQIAPAPAQGIARQTSLPPHTAKGYLKKSVQKSPDLKGAKASKASKKLNQLRGRSARSPRKRTTQGNHSIVSSSSAVPRNEVFPSAISKNTLSLSGSVVSQKPPSKRL
ncbi:hypothetical protein Bca4012_092878 [Brassica carinata]